MHKHFLLLLTITTNTAIFASDANIKITTKTTTTTEHHIELRGITTIDLPVEAFPNAPKLDRNAGSLPFYAGSLPTSTVAASLLAQAQSQPNGYNLGASGNNKPQLLKAPHVPAYTTYSTVTVQQNDQLRKLEKELGL